MNDIQIDASKGPVSREQFDAAIAEADAAPTKAARPITFPKNADGEWVNSETGVKVVRHGKGYRAFRPADTSTGYIGVCAEVPTLARARAEATFYVRNSARPAIAAAYAAAVAEAVAEDRVRDANRLCDCDGTHAPVDGGHSIACRGREVLDLDQPSVDEQHAEALTENAARRVVYLGSERVSDIPSGLCLRADPPHIPHMQAVSAECRDEQVQEKRQFCRKCLDSRVPAVTLTFDRGDRIGRLHWCADCADDAEQYRPQSREADGAAFIYAADKPAEDTSQVMWRDGADDYAMASEVIADMQIPADFVASKLPPVPDDVDDESGWAAYCAALPAPTRDEVAATLAEVASPYAENIAQASETFRLSARVIWTGRRQGTLTASDYHRMRECMSATRRCIEIYRGLARSWAEREMFAAETVAQ